MYGRQQYAPFKFLWNIEEFYGVSLFYFKSFEF